MLRVSISKTRSSLLSLRMTLRGKLRLHDTVSRRTCVQVVLSRSHPVVRSTHTPLSKFCLLPVALISLHRMEYLLLHQSTKRPIILLTLTLVIHPNFHRHLNLTLGLVPR